MFPKTGKLLRTLMGHTGRVESLNFSPDGKTLATGGGGGDTYLCIDTYLSMGELPARLMFS